MAANDSGSMGVNYRRRVIYQALSETFQDPQQIRRYFDLWQREHSHEAHFVVTRFAAVVATAAGFSAEQKSAFQRRLFHGLTQSYETLPRVPDAWFAGAGQTGEAPAATATVVSIPTPTRNTPPRPPVTEPVIAADFEAPERIVFKAFAQPIVAAILAKTDRHQDVLAQAVDDLGAGAAGRAQELHLALKRWSRARFAADALPPLRAQEDLRHLAHQLYLLAVDFLGPMPADRLLAQAAAEAERLPEAATFSPQSLL
jgi:hypothetical protein